MMLKAGRGSRAAASSGRMGHRLDFQTSLPNSVDFVPENYAAPPESG
jgi:hypothetical protein